MPYAEKEVLLLRFDRGAAVHVRLSGAVRVYWIAANMLDVMCPSVGVCNSVSIVGKQNRCVVRCAPSLPLPYIYHVPSSPGLLELERRVVQVNNVLSGFVKKTMCCLCGLALVC